MAVETRVELVHVVCCFGAAAVGGFPRAAAEEDGDVHAGGPMRSLEVADAELVADGGYDLVAPVVLHLGQDG